MLTLERDASDKIHLSMKSESLATLGQAGLEQGGTRSSRFSRSGNSPWIEQKLCETTEPWKASHQVLDLLPTWKTGETTLCNGL